MDEKIIEKTIGEKWREVMVGKGTKQVWVAEQAGISPEHLSNILADRVLITDENVKKINDVLGTDFKQG
jgi:plasmid maintenance system antidote protein VapI